MLNPVQTNPVGNSRYSNGTCYVIIPEDVNRDSYIVNCYRRGRISVQFEDGSFMPDVPIGFNVLKEIDFPLENRQLGSQLIYVTEPIHNQPIIIDRILKDDESTNLIENEFKFQKYTDTGSVSISGVAKDGNLFIRVDGRSSDGGKIYVDVGNPDNAGEIIVNIKGDLRSELQNMILNILQELNITSKGDINVLSEGDININPTEDGKKVNLGTGGQPILLGDDTESVLNDIQSILDSLNTALDTFTTATGAAIVEPTLAPASAALKVSLGTIAVLISQLINAISLIKSKKSFAE